MEDAVNRMEETGVKETLAPMSLYTQRPKQYKSVLWSVCGFILLMELAERLSYYGINQGLKNFMQAKLQWSAVSANSLKSTWTSLVYMSPLMGAYIADEKWGRYCTITTFGILYLIGDCLLCIAAHPSVLAHHDIAQVIFILGLFGCIGLGTGAIKSNVITLGADQFNPDDINETQQKATYFSYFYWCINFGAAFAYGYLASLSVHGSALIPPEYGYFSCFAICTCVMGFALISLRLGYSRYIRIPPSSRAMSMLIQVLYNQAKHCHSAKGVVLGFQSFMVSFILNCIATTASGSQIRLVLSLFAGLFSTIGIGLWAVFGQNSIRSVKNDSNEEAVMSEIDDVQRVVRILPFAAFTIVWGCVSDQIDANFQSITQQCDLRLTNTTQLPGAVLGIFDPLAIMILIPLLDSVVYPLYDRLFGRLPSSYGKVCIGLLLSTTLMFYVGAFEIVRRESGLINNTILRDEGSGSPMNRLHWAWNIPHYVVVALCECLINVTAYDVFYSNVPMSLKSTAQAINLFTFSMGSNITSIFTLAFGHWIPNDLNEGHLEYMFFGVGVLSLINVVAYVVVMHRMQFGMSSTGYGLVNARENIENTLDSIDSIDDDFPDMDSKIHGKSPTELATPSIMTSISKHPVVFVLIDGIGDVSIDVSKYKSGNTSTSTALQAANIPAMDAIAQAGLNGLMDPVEPGMACGSDTAHLSILGYSPTKYYRGRGSFEAMGAGLDMQPGDVAFKCNFAHLDRSSNIVTMRRVDRNFHAWGTELCPFVSTMTLPSFPGVRVICKYATEHRCGIVFKGLNLSDQITGTDPLKDNLPLLTSSPKDPTSPNAVYSSQVLNEASSVIIEMLSQHPINLAREKEGLAPANVVLFRGPGERIDVPNFETMHGLKPFMIAPTCIIAGLGKSLDMDVVPVDGATGDYHTNLLNKAEAALNLFQSQKYDFGFVHVKAVDDAGHDRDVAKKIHFLEKADEMIARLIQGIASTIDDEATIVVTGDHSTPVLYGDHTFEPVPFAIANVKAASKVLEKKTSLHSLQDKAQKYSEVDAASGALGRFSGDQVMTIVKAFRAQNI